MRESVPILILSVASPFTMSNSVKAGVDIKIGVIFLLTILGPSVSWETFSQVT
jgi:hypothetical protein